MTDPAKRFDARERPEDSPIAWFGELLLAIDRGEYSRASQAQAQLRRLGWRVARCRLRPRGKEAAQ
jgi:hypothetical protein